jgi:hypothetical protein
MPPALPITSCGTVMVYSVLSAMSPVELSESDS